MAAQLQPESNEQDVLEANQAFYEALQSLDLAQMEEIWLHEDWVGCLRPGWELIMSWQDVRESWANIFRSTGQVRVGISRAWVHGEGETAWFRCIENATAASQEGFSTTVVEVTNTFVRRHGRWRLAHRHTTSLAGRVPSGTSLSVQ